MKPTRPHRRRSLFSGFTLIELLVVLVILAALAALIVPNIGMFGRSSDMAVSAKSQADVANQISLFFVTQKRYPQGFDSLLTNDASPAVYSQPTPATSETQTYGFPLAGADGTNLGAQLTAATLANATNEEYLRSFTRAGFDWLWDHNPAAVNSNTSNTTFRGLVTNMNPPAGQTAPASNLSSVSVAEVTGTYLRGKLVPTGLRPGQRLIALGFGDKNTAIGKTTTTCPLYPGADKTYYGRYIVYFMVYASGERASLVGVSDAYGRTPDYTQQQFNESLPDGGRQG